MDYDLDMAVLEVYCYEGHPMTNEEKGVNGRNLIYIAQERAFAPGIAGEWPKIIKHPKSKNGRLVAVNLTNTLMRKIDQFISIPKEHKDG